MTLIDRLLSLAALWAEHNERSDSTLASRVARDGKLFERVRGGASVTTVTLERFFAFFRDPVNWRGDVPSRVSELLDGVDLSAGHGPTDTDAPQQASSGNADQDFRAVQA